MRILILGMNYAPESTGIGPYTTEFAEFLQHLGNEVHVVTAPPHFPEWRVWNNYQRWHFTRECVSGVSIHRTYAYVPANPRRVLSRVMYDTLFSISALLRAALLKRFDVVFAVAPPVQLGLAAWVLARLHGTPLFFQVQDIASRAVTGVGMATESSLVSRAARMLEDAAHRRADAVGVICEAFGRHLRASGVPAGKIVFFPNYVDSESLQPGHRLGPFRARHGLAAQDFVVMYSGGIAHKQGLETLVSAAAALSHCPRFKFFIIGEGSTKADLMNKVTAEGLANVSILPLQPKDQLAEQLSAADILVLTQKADVTDAVFPSKLLSYMACERPILAAAANDSETATFIRANKVGIVVPPETPGALAEAVVYLANHPEEAAELARNARQTVISRFEKSAVLSRIAGILTGGRLALDHASI